VITAVLQVLIVLGVVGCGLMAGAFFAFSTSVMPGLARLSGPAGAAAMQQANRAILNPLFLAVFVGTALVCLLVAILAVVAGHAGTAWLVAGALLYLVGAFAVTTVVNVPMNNRLDVSDPDSAEGARTWAAYLSRWTAWNHLRAAVSTLATAALAAGLLA
jgi:uncharacterized membrane protein